MGGTEREKPKGKGLRYADAGVDREAKDRALREIRPLLEATRTRGVIADLGAFGGMFQPDLSGLEAPVLVASCDGLGTKLRVAIETGLHSTIGRDLVNHCVNDILVQGARPLFFLDYLATGRFAPGVFVAVVEGIARGCRENGCALLGGETAEMPGFYGPEEYDLAGFIVGVADRAMVLDGSRVRPGDVLIGLPSAGLHTNGYSLARKILFEVAGYEVTTRIEELGATVGEALLWEHRSYLPALSTALKKGLLRGLAHVTGGGLTENVPRILPAGAAARIEKSSWAAPPLFRILERLGEVPEVEMLRTFNMGIGMVVVTAREDAGQVETLLDAAGEGHHRIGSIVAGQRDVVYV